MSATAEAIPMGNSTRTHIPDLLKPIKKILKPLEKIILTLIILVVLGLLIFAGYVNFIQSGEADASATQASVALGKSDSGFLSKLGLTKVKDLFNPDKQYEDSWESEIEEGTEMAGIRIAEFRQEESITFSGEPIYLRGIISGKSIKGETSFAAYCDLSKDSGALKANTKKPALLYGTSVSSQNQGILREDFEETFEVVCEFPEGLIPEKNVVAAEAKLYLTYEFETRGSYSIYLMDKETLDYVKYKKKKDPFDYYKLAAERDADGSIPSITTGGPINIGTEITQTQPLAEQSKYSLKISLSPGSGIVERGYIQDLAILEVMVPEYIRLDTKAGSLTQNLCAFEYSGPSEMKGWTSYTLSKEKMEEINKECNENSLLVIGQTKEDCLDLYKGKKVYRCPILVDADFPEDDIFQDFIRTYAKYTYQIEEPGFVKVTQTPEQMAQNNEGNVVQNIIENIV